ALLFGALTSGCGNGSDNTAESEPDEAASGQPAAESRGGTITVGDRTWTVVPSTQCSIYPGDIVMIAGHTADNGEIEVVIDHDPSSKLVSAYIQGPDNSPYWIAEDDAISFVIEGKTVSASGTFSVGLGGRVEEGQPRELEGSLEIRC
ncbi:MAG TPA: hypothetical protein VK973_18365, partial [Arenicellales bacterium]|nr:hypothetical protein [Arenicellales bacterium]